MTFVGSSRDADDPVNIVHHRILSIDATIDVDGQYRRLVAAQVNLSGGASCPCLPISVRSGGGGTKRVDGTLTNAIVFPSPPCSVGGTTAPIISGGTYPSLHPTAEGGHPTSAHNDVRDGRGGTSHGGPTSIRGGVSCADERAERGVRDRGAFVLPPWGGDDAFGTYRLHAEGRVVGSLAQFFWGVNANLQGSTESNVATCPISLPPYSYQRVEGALPC